MMYSELMSIDDIRAQQQLQYLLYSVIMSHKYPEMFPSPHSQPHATNLSYTGQPGLDLPWGLRGFDPGWKNRDPGWRTSPKMQQGSHFDPQLTTTIREVRPDDIYFNFTLLFV